MAVVLFWSIFSGINVGHKVAQSKAISQTAKNLNLGLQYFYSDQNRFPSATEFADQNTMRNYFSVFPPADFISSNCSQSFVYKRINEDSFQLNFCLPLANGAHQAGWNTVNGSPNLMIN